MNIFCCCGLVYFVVVWLVYGCSLPVELLKHLGFLHVHLLTFQGCRLRNTEWMYGVVIYAGSDTKLVQNSGELHQ